MCLYIFSDKRMKTKKDTYFSRKRVTLNFMFGPKIIIGAEMYVELLELVTISQRTLGDVQNVLRVFIHSED